jgi:exosortase
VIPAKQMATRIEAASLSQANAHTGFSRLIVFAAICVLPLVLAGSLMRQIVNLTFENDTYTHIPLIPLVSLFLIFNERRSIFRVVSYSWQFGLLLVAPGAIAIILARLNEFQLGPSNQLCLVMLGLVAMWIGALGVSWGPSASKLARFPLLFLLFMIPIPEPLLSKSVFFLQEASAKATAAIFGLYGIPFLQDDLVFSLPGMAIRIAEECSGIRSTLALLIMTVLASHLFLKTTWKKVLVCLLVIPLSIIKNGLRIATLSALAVYVDERFLTGPVHHEFGGMLFFGAAFVPLVLLFIWLRRSDIRNRSVADINTLA